MKILGLIPARGGSKSIPLKNIKILDGKPLIYYSIISAIKSKIFNYIVVSTDNKKIKNKCNKFKKIKVLDRHKNISDDKSSTEDVVKDVLIKMKKNFNYYPDYIFILEPTSPFRSIQTILKAKKIIKSKKINSLITVKEIGHIPGKIKNNKFYYNEKRINRRQERESYYEESSTLYCVKSKYFQSTNNIVSKNPCCFMVEKTEAIDINTNEDFLLASKIKR